MRFSSTHISNKKSNSFGMQMKTYQADSSSYRFGFQGQETDDETYGKGNAYDFGARIYDSRLGRWLALDPLMKKFPYTSPFSFCLNNPILLYDPNGKRPYLYITNIITGYTVQRVYGDGTGASKSHLIVVPTYKAIIGDYNSETGVLVDLLNINVTRDAWYFRGKDEQGDNILMNRAFESNTNESMTAYHTEVQNGFPSGDLVAYRLLNENHEKELGATPFPETTNTDGTPIKDARNVNSIATGVMFHIGGYYDYDIGEFGPFDFVYRDIERLAASNGCFMYIPYDDVYQTENMAYAAIYNNNTYSNSTSNKPYTLVTNMIQNLESNSEKSLIIVVDKRFSVSWYAITTNNNVQGCETSSEENNDCPNENTETPVFGPGY